MSGLVNKVKDALSGDHHDTTTTHGTTHTTSGPHQSDVANKVDPRVDSDRDHRGAHGQSTAGYGQKTTHGPHESDIMNKADPRVDSDRDHRAAGTTGGYGSHAGAPGLTGTTGTTGGYGSTHTAGSTNYGPHDSNIANKMDPRVDSDLDHRGARGTGTHGTHTETHGIHTGTHAGTGAYGTGTTREYGSGLGTHGTHGTTTHGAHGTHGTHGTTGTTGAGYGSGNHGTHDAPVLNKLDPRFESGHGHHAAGTTGGYGTSHTAGSTGAYGSGTTDHGVHGTHTGPAPNTAGPHKSDMMNKLDPRVDSDLDGSQTMGGDKTFSTGPHAGKDRTDAAQVPPSAFLSHGAHEGAGGEQMHMNM